MRNLEERRKYQREYQRKRWREKHKKTSELTRNEFDQYAYKVVPNSWRELVPASARREKYETPEITSPLVRDILAGKTCYVDYFIPFGKSDHPFRTLYSYFQARGYRLRVHIIDNVKDEEYRRLIMWCEPLIRAAG